MSVEEFDRRQITLYVPHAERARIEQLRERYNPIQFSLINAHVTLCRDEEVCDWPNLLTRAQQIHAIDISLEFGSPIKEGDLVYLPVAGTTDDFDNLRIRLLEDPNCRIQEPHITIVHPRNGTCNGEQFEKICEVFSANFTIPFRSFTFIQKHGAEPWENICTFPDATD